MGHYHKEAKDFLAYVMADQLQIVNMVKSLLYLRASNQTHAQEFQKDLYLHTKIPNQ